MSLAISLHNLGQLSALLLWIATMGLSIGAAAMFAAIYAYSSEIITFTNKMSTLFMLSRALFTLVTPIIIGHFIESYSQIFIVIEAIFMAASLGLFMIIWLMTRKWSRQITKLTPKQFPDI